MVAMLERFNVLSELFNSMRLRVQTPDDNNGRTDSAAIEASASIYPIGENHPLSVVIGAFVDEPLWDDWMAAIQEYRQQVTAAELHELGE